MIVFKTWDNVPHNFAGHCYIEEDETQFHLIENRIWHNENGPAVISDNGDKEWWFKDQRHRIDGPAMVWFDDEENKPMEKYLIHGQLFSPEDYYKHPLVAKHLLENILKL